MTSNRAELELEIACRDISGPVVSGRRRPPLVNYLLGLPAALFLCVLAVPVAITLGEAFSAGTGNFEKLFQDADARRAISNSVIWVCVALGLTVLAFGIAVLSQRASRVSRVLLLALVAPVGVSALVAGASFRLIFDPSRERGTASALAGLAGWAPDWLGPELVGLVLVSAFGWAWLGFAVSLFRAGLDAVSPDLLRMARAEGVGPLRRTMTVLVPVLQPVIAVVVLTLVVAAVRLFDLVLVAVPGSMRDEAQVVALYWWQTKSPPTSGPAAALATLLFLAVAVVALFGIVGLRRAWAMPQPVVRRPAPPRPRERRRGSALAALAVAALWLFPLLVVLATAFHDPADAGRSGWWVFGSGPSLTSLAEAIDAGLGEALMSTALLATTATALVLIVAVPGAYLLAWGGLPRWPRRIVTGLLAVLAVAPAQMYTEPLSRLFAWVGLAGSRMPLALVHAAVGLPFAILLLRTAFAAIPPGKALGPPFGEAGHRRAMAEVTRRSIPAVVAVAVLEFVQVWNDFTIGLLVSGPGATPLTQVLWGQARQFATSAGPVAASAVVSAVVPVALVLATWPTVVRGLTGGVLR